MLNGYRLATWLGGVLVAVIVVVGASQPVFADECSVNGSDCGLGYFYRDPEPPPPRHNVMSTPAMTNVDDVDDLVATVRSHMTCNGNDLENEDYQNAVGSAFIILTMLGYPPGTHKDKSCEVFDEWERTVRAWPSVNYNVMYDFEGLNTRSSYVDVAYYISPERSADSIVFYDPSTGEPLYAIKKDCANPVGRLQSLSRSYTLTPHVDSVSPTKVEPGSNVTVTSSVDNEGEVDSANTQWEITQITVKPGKKAPHEDEGPTVSGEAPCQSNGGAPSGNYFRSGDADCKNVAKGNGVFELGSPSQNLKPGVADLAVGDLPVGTRLCFTLSVQPRSNTDTQWAHSKPVCTIVGKKPKVQVWGGDVSVRGKIDTSTSVKSLAGTQRIFGSWVEYGAFSVGPNAGFASGSGTVNQTQEAQAAWSKLTFANKDNGIDSFGRFTSPGGFRPLPTVAQYFGAIANRQPANSSDVNTLSFANGGPATVRVAGDLTLSGGSMSAGRSTIIIATGTVTIEGNINYANGPFGSLRDIPQVVIIAQDIRIKDSVSRVDAWLVASGTIDTCYNVSGYLTSNKCSTMLEVNGPVITNHLVLKRTAGSDTGEQSGDPAERFNLRSDAYLWASLQARGNNKAQTVYSTELPPRF